MRYEYVVETTCTPCCTGCEQGKHERGGWHVVYSARSLAKAKEDEREWKMRIAQFGDVQTRIVRSPIPAGIR